MNVLGFDTSTNSISLAIYHNNRFLVNFNHKADFGSSQLLGYIEKQIKKYGLILGDFDYFVIGKGPGSFTGLRIGFSIAKALRLALNKPILTLGSFYSIAQEFKNRFNKIAVIADARKGLVYAACFSVKKGKIKLEKKECLTKLNNFVQKNKGYFFITPDANLRGEIKKLNLGVNMYDEEVYPNARNLIILSSQTNISRMSNLHNELEPLYLHAKTCQIKKLG